MIDIVQQRARTYCEALGRDPDEIVVGFYQRQRHEHPLWAATIGADPSLAEGATELSPKQVALLAERRGGQPT